VAQVQAEWDAGSRRLLVSRLLGSCQAIGPGSRQLEVWSLELVQRGGGGMTDVLLHLPISIAHACSTRVQLTYSATPFCCGKSCTVSCHTMPQSLR
jgi:hypothetical protein